MIKLHPVWFYLKRGEKKDKKRQKKMKKRRKKCRGELTGIAMGDNIILTVAPEGASGEAWQKREGTNGQK